MKTQREQAQVDEDFWETLETLLDQGVDIGQHARRMLEKPRKPRKQVLKSPRKLEDFK